MSDCCFSRNQGKTCALHSPTLGREHPPGQHSPFLGLSMAAGPALNSALLPQLLRTAEDVAKMQEELESSRPLLAQAAKDTEATIEQIKVPLLGSPALCNSDCSDWTGHRLEGPGRDCAKSCLIGGKNASDWHGRYLCRAALTPKTASCWGPALLWVSTSCCRNDGSHAPV